MDDTEYNLWCAEIDLCTDVGRLTDLAQRMRDLLDKEKPKHWKPALMYNNLIRYAVLHRNALQIGGRV